MTRESVEESGLRLGFPADESFRFQDLVGYRALCGQSLKEMDFAWHHKATLYLLEIRDYRELAQSMHRDDLVPTSKDVAPYRFLQLVDKVTDCLLMLLAVRASTKRSRALAKQLPDFAKTHIPVRLIIALGLPPNLKIHLGVLRQALNARLKGRIVLADIDAVSVLDYERLCEKAPALGLDCEPLTNNQ